MEVVVTSPLKCAYNTTFFMHYLSFNKILCDNLAFTVVYEYSNVERG